MGMISITDCVDRSREPYSLSVGWVTRDLSGLTDGSPMLRARGVWTQAWGPGGLQVRVPLTRTAQVAVLLGLDAADPAPSISVSQVEVDYGDTVIAGVPADAVWVSPHVPGAEHTRRVVALWSTTPPASWQRPRLVIVVLGGRRVAMGEVGAWLTEDAKIAPRISDDVEMRERVSYTVTGTPVRGLIHTLFRRLSFSESPATPYTAAVSRRDRWVRQGLALMVPHSWPAGALLPDRCQHIGEHGLIGIPYAGGLSMDGVGRGTIVGSTQLGLHVIEASPVQVLEDVIMSLAAHTLSPHAYRPLPGEHIPAFTGQTLTTQAAAAGRYDVWPIVMPVDTTIDQAAFEVTAAATGDAAVVIHAADDLGRPAGLVAQSLPISTGTTGLRTGTISATLRAGTQYWVGIWTQAAPTLRAVSDALPISWAASAPPAARRVLRRTVTWGGMGPVWSYTASDPVAASPAAVLFRVA